MMGKDMCLTGSLNRAGSERVEYSLYIVQEDVARLMFAISLLHPFELLAT